MMMMMMMMAVAAVIVVIVTCVSLSIFVCLLCVFMSYNCYLSSCVPFSIHHVFTLWLFAAVEFGGWLCVFVCWFVLVCLYLSFLFCYIVFLFPYIVLSSLRLVARGVFELRFS